jgi:hypothetical protein
MIDERVEDMGTTIGTEQTKSECSCKDNGCEGKDDFVNEVAKRIFGSDWVDSVGANKLMILAEVDILIKKCTQAQREVTDLKSKLGATTIVSDQLKVKLEQSKQYSRESKSAMDAKERLSELLSSNGSSLTWDNIIERTMSAISHLRMQAPLLQEAESELKRMRKELNMPETSSSDDVQARLALLENDLKIFRVIGRLGARLLSLDSLFRKR